MLVAVNMVGARRWCSVVLMLGHRFQCPHHLGVSWRRTPFTFILNDDRLLYTALFFKSITLRVWALSLFISLFSALNKLSSDIYYMNVRP